MIKPYYHDDGYVELSVDEDFSSPLDTVHEGQEIQVKTKQVFLRNDDATKWYKDIVLTPVDLEGIVGDEDVSYDETGWGMKIYPGSTEPSSDEWEALDWGNSISMSDIGSSGSPDTTTYHSFWILITSPVCDAQNKINLSVKVEFTEMAV